MALSQMDYTGNGGSSVVFGDTIKINGTETNATTATSQEFTVETGLSAIKHFVLSAHCTLSSYVDYRQIVDYDDARGKYNSAVQYPSGAYGSLAITVGTTANGRAFTLKSISGGTVTLETGNTDVNYSACDDFYWFAE